jgi:hypothetical protein
VCLFNGLAEKPEVLGPVQALKKTTENYSRLGPITRLGGEGLGRSYPSAAPSCHPFCRH